MSQNPTPSPETKQEAMNIARATQKPGQNKEQTKLIAQGIEKGIALYKKQQKEKQRNADKERKKIQKQKLQQAESEQDQEIISEASETSGNSSVVPWILLVVSWIGFGVYLFLGK